MGKRDRRVDAYIEKTGDFAKPILAYIREAAHAAIPDVEETMKWSTPFFDYKGTLAMMAAFKEHVRFGFWKGSIIGQRFERVTSVKDLPSKKELVALFRKAAELNEQGIKVEKKKSVKPPLETPDDLAAALKKNRKAVAAFEAFPPSHRREYIAWITEAKAAETRKRRIDQAIEWISEGRQRNWKYMKKS